MRLDQRFHQNQKKKRKKVRNGTKGSFRNHEPENTSIDSNLPKSYLDLLPKL